MCVEDVQLFLWAPERHFPGKGMMAVHLQTDSCRLSY